MMTPFLLHDDIVLLSLFSLLLLLLLWYNHQEMSDI